MLLASPPLGQLAFLAVETETILAPKATSIDQSFTVIQNWLGLLCKNIRNKVPSPKL